MSEMNKVQTIINMVAEKEGVDDHLIVSPRRNKEIAHARFVVFYLIYSLTNYSMSAIARMFNKDHTSILYGIRKITEKRKKDLVLDSTLRFFESTLGHNHHLRSPEIEKRIKIPA